MTFNTVAEDSEVRKALWAAICDGTTKLSGACTVHISGPLDIESRINPKMPVPEVQTWQMVEALSLLTILIKADSVITAEVCNLFGQSGPIHFTEDGQDRYLWAQPTITGKESELYGRPDLVVTSSTEKPSARTTLNIIECKCRKHLGAHDIRAEFGKAFDLKAASYLIWSFWTPSPKCIAGARRLGLDLVALGFDSQKREELIAKPENLVAHIANTVEISRREKHFVGALLESGQDITRKMLDLK